MQVSCFNANFLAVKTSLFAIKAGEIQRLSYPYTPTEYNTIQTKCYSEFLPIYILLSACCVYFVFSNCCRNVRLCKIYWKVSWLEFVSSTLSTVYSKLIWYWKYKYRFFLTCIEFSRLFSNQPDLTFPTSVHSPQSSVWSVVGNDHKLIPILLSAYS